MHTIYNHIKFILAVRNIIFNEVITYHNNMIYDITYYNNK